MSPQVISFGELLIDFVAMERDTSVGDASGFIKKPGGAPANVAAGLAKLGIDTAFMSMMGDDFFGHYLAGVLGETGVDLSGLRYTDKAMTALAFVAVEANGERSFVFYRKPSADMMMTEADLDQDMLKSTQVFSYGSISLIAEPTKSTLLIAIKIAKDNGALICYDPNLREPLWDSLAAAKEGMLLGMQFADVVKVSEEELEILTDESDLHAGVKKLWQGDMKLIAVTKGAGGCSAFTRDREWHVPGFSITVEDTIGAGDGFVAGLISGILALGQDWLAQDLAPVLRRANAVGAITASRAGAIPALPTDEELKAFLATQ